MRTKNSSFQKKRASGEVQLEGGVGAIRTKVQQLQLARLGCPPSACLPAAGPSAAHAQWETGRGACAREGQADVAQAHYAPYKTRRIWANQTWPWGECLSSGLEWEMSFREFDFSSDVLNVTFDYHIIFNTAQCAYSVNPVWLFRRPQFDFRNKFE